MGWVLFGFIVALLIEQFIRVAGKYERVEPRRQHKVEVSMPWYGWAGAAYVATRKQRSKD